MTQTRIFAMGFISIQKSRNAGLRGGYLILNAYGRPLEFHYSSEVVLSEMQRSLFGTTEKDNLYSELIAKSLTQRQKTPPRVILVDSEPLVISAVTGQGLNQLIGAIVKALEEARGRAIL